MGLDGVNLSVMSPLKFTPSSVSSATLRIPEFGAKTIISRSNPTVKALRVLSE